jgi:hypothetical protein
MATYYRQLVILLILVVFFGCDLTDVTINLTQSTLEVSESELVADGSSSLLVTVTLRDGKGDTVSEGGHDVSIFTDLGVLMWEVYDNDDGTYTQALMATPVTEQATITASVNDQLLEATATVDFTPGSNYRDISLSQSDL